MNKIMILGAGAMGCLFGARLTQAGYDVALVDVWREHIEAINAAGLKLHSDDGEHTVRIKAGSAADINVHPDLVIVFTKTLHTATALESVRHLFGEQTYLLTLQNGLGNVETLGRFATAERLMHGVTNYPSDLKGPGHVSSHGSGYIRIYGVAGLCSDAQQAIADALCQAGFNCTLDADVERAIWEKVAFNAAMNSLTAVTGMTVGQVGASMSGPVLARQIVTETADVARAKNIVIDADAIWQSIRTVFVEHAQHKPSMLQDILQGRATEIESINGAIVAVARTHQVPAPVTETLCHLVRMIERRPGNSSG
ncbi:ketopantoate reductase family protein [Herbaspirillum sp. NPDC101397]|uniref:ketopantoate reductase family protein n=1 Tax=Herbaspirillum sp. NPDC101397 TaxID=3364006 RepID=UPI00383B577A